MRKSLQIAIRRQHQGDSQEYMIFNASDQSFSSHVFTFITRGVMPGDILTQHRLCAQVTAVADVLKS